MTYEVPPSPAEYIFSGPEVALVERVLAAAVEQAGQSADDLEDACGAEGLDPLSAVYARWARHARSLELSAYALPVDGHGLLPVTVPGGDVPLLVMALKSHLVDLGEGDYYQRDVDEIWGIIWRLEGLLRW